MLELAREHNPALDAVEWIHGDGTSLEPLADASADACFSQVVFQHIPDPEITLGYVAEMGRVLRPGGSAVELPALAAAGSAGMEVERVSGEGTQWCLVLLRHSQSAATE